jgi:integrase
MPFFLKHPNDKKPTLILLHYHFSGRRLVMSTGEKIEPKYWNYNTNRPRSSFNNATILTAYLDKIERILQEIHLNMKSRNETVTKDILTQSLKLALRNGNKKENLQDYFERWILDHEGGIKYKSMAGHKSALKLLKGFKGPKEFDDVNSKWFERYQHYLEGNNYSANYIGKNIKVIMEIMSQAIKDGVSHNNHYKTEDYKIPSEDTDSIYLTIDELLKIYGIDLPDYLDRVRNRYIIAGFTALRFSDTVKITQDSIRDGLLFDRNQKTGTQVIIPLHWTVKQILEDHPEGLPPSISNQKTNKYLKEIGKRAGIDANIQIIKTIGGKQTVITKKKYEMITTHTFRRSAATNMVLAGISERSIMLLTGHKSDTAFRLYIRITKEENARKLQNDDFFQPL